MVYRSGDSRLVFRSVSRNECCGIYVCAACEGLAEFDKPTPREQRFDCLEFLVFNAQFPKSLDNAQGQADVTGLYRETSHCGRALDDRADVKPVPIPTTMDWEFALCVGAPALTSVNWSLCSVGTA